MVWLDEIVNAELIERYEANGDAMIHIVGFCELQPAGKNGRRIRRFPAAPSELACGESGQIRPNPGESGQIVASHTHTQSHTHSHSEVLGNPGESGQIQNQDDALEDALFRGITYPPPLNTPEFRTAFLEWRTNRQAKGDGMTPLEIRACLEGLSPIGPVRAIAAIKSSLGAGYKKIVEDREARKAVAAEDASARIAAITARVWLKK